MAQSEGIWCSILNSKVRNAINGKDKGIMTADDRESHTLKWCGENIVRLIIKDFVNLATIFGFTRISKKTSAEFYTMLSLMLRQNAAWIAYNHTDLSAKLKRHRVTADEVRKAKHLASHEKIGPFPSKHW